MIEQQRTLEGRQIEFINGIHFFRQAGGCLEIGREDNLVHICSGEIRDFMKCLNQFVEDTKVNLH